ncbi:unnamed protein product, partial [Closterium sp. NIES-54]
DHIGKKPISAWLTRFASRNLLQDNEWTVASDLRSKYGFGPSRKSPGKGKGKGRGKDGEAGGVDSGGGSGEGRMGGVGADGAEGESKKRKASVVNGVEKGGAGAQKQQKRGKEEEGGGGVVATGGEEGEGAAPTGKCHVCKRKVSKDNVPLLLSCSTCPRAFHLPCLPAAMLPPAAQLTESQPTAEKNHESQGQGSQGGAEKSDLRPVASPEGGEKEGGGKEGGEKEGVKEGGGQALLCPVCWR